VKALARHLMTNTIDSERGPVPTVFTELRPGEKMCEALLSDREAYVAHADSGQPLRAIKSPCLPATVLDEILRELQHACRERSLEQLLAAVLRAVPEYRLSALMQASREETL
jgi:FlaA1/EpsC-like NDP-sugar epimerase